MTSLSVMLLYLTRDHGDSHIPPSWSSLFGTSSPLARYEIQRQDRTLGGTPTYRRSLHCKSPASELKDAAPSAKAVTGPSAAPCDPDGTARGCGLQVHLLLEQLMPSMVAGKRLMTPVESRWKEQ